MSGKVGTKNYTNIGIISKTIAEYLENEDLSLYYIAAHDFNPGVRIIPSDYVQNTDIYSTEEDLQKYASLPHLRKLDMKMCNNISRRIWKGISSNVVKLSMPNCKQIDDISLKYVADGFKSLESINISSCNVTDVGVRFLIKLTKLKKIQMSFCSKVSLDEVSKITTLTKIIASFCKINDTGLKLLEELKLEKLKINGISNITSKGILSISRITTLTQLELAFCRTEDSHLTNKELTCLSKLINLELLDLAASQISGSGLRSILQGLPKLIELHLRYCERLTDFSGLEFCTKLNTLFLPESFTYDQLIYLLPITNLTVLNIDSYLDEEYMELIPNKSRLTSLNIENNEVEGDCIGEFVSLKRLNLNEWSQFECKNISLLSNLTNLQYLSLEDRFPTSEYLKSIFLLTNLTELDLSTNEKRDEHIEDLSGISKLSKLTLLNANMRKINKEGMKEIAQLTKLEGLKIRACGAINNKIFIKYLIELSNLTQLDISLNNVTFKSIVHLPKLKFLTKLNIAYIKELNRDCLAIITTMTQLNSLSLEGCRLSNKEISTLSKLTNLESLNISSSLIRASGLSILADLSKLKILIISNCNKVKSGGLASLSRSKSLTSLNVNYCDNMTNQDLADIDNIANLSFLYLNGCSSIDKVEIEKLNKNKEYTQIQFTTIRCDCEICTNNYIDSDY